MRTLITSFLVVLILFGESKGQLIQDGNFIPSNFKSTFVKGRSSSMNKSSQCAVDTLYYGRYNASSHGFVQIQPSNGQLGVGQFFALQDTMMLIGLKFYGYATVQNQTVTCKVFNANASKRPSGAALASKQYILNTGFNLLPYMIQTLTFTNPVQLTQNFVITIEGTSTTSNLIFASNSWADSNGLGNHYANLKFSTGWTNSLNIGTPPVPFDADFYFEPIVSYKMKARFEHGDNSCLGNGLPFEFINTSTFASNPQFSFEMIDNTLDDNFNWDYGDGNMDTIFHGNNFYAKDTDHVVNMGGYFEQWIGGICSDSTTELLESLDLNATFIYSGQDKLIEFTDKSTDAVKWFWDFGDGTSGAQQKNPKHLYTAYGNYPVKLIISNRGCKDSTTLVIKVEQSFDGIGDVENKFGLKLTPNPADNHLNIQLSKSFDIQWRIFNLQGSTSSKGSFEGQTQRIDISELEKGVYFIRIDDGESILTNRFIKL